MAQSLDKPTTIQELDTKILLLAEQNAHLQKTVSSLLEAVTIQANLHVQNSTVQSKSMPVLPAIPFEKYDETSEDFETFTERFAAYLDLKEVPEDKKVKYFVMSLSPCLFQLCKDLLYPDNYETKTLEELQTLLKNHIKPRPLMIPSRHTLLNRKQQEGETVSQYVTELRKLAPPCRYPADMLNTVLRDIFVGGLKDKQILDRLFEEDDISFEKTIEIASAIEKASQGARDILSVPSFAVNKISDKPKSPKSTFSRDKENRRCFRCGKNTHTAKYCKIKNLVCSLCKKPNHVASVCFSRERGVNSLRQEEQVSSTPITTDEHSHDVTPCMTLPIYTLQKSNTNEPLIIRVQVNGNPLPFELDTGSAVTVVDKNTLLSILPEDKILPTTAVFRAYDNGIVKPEGEVNVNVEYKNTSRTLKLYVVSGNKTSLLGRDWIYPLGILPNVINQLSVCTKTPKSVEPLIRKYDVLFHESVKPIKDYTYDILLKDNAQPRFRKARTVPFSLQARVEQEIRRLEQEGIIEATTFSTWATPVVPIVKPNGSIRLCADYSRTVNDQMIVPQHPFPGFEEVLNKLKGGQKFSTLDVKTAFLHIPVTQKTSEVLTINTHLGLFRVKRLMFGVSSAPAIWQKYIESVLSGLRGVAVVHDDIIVTGANDEEHLTNLEALLTSLKNKGINLNKEKCKFLQERVKYLGYVIDREGIRKTPEMVESILSCKRPTNTTEVKSFLGMITFYGRFLNHLATLATPLYNLLRKENTFRWTEVEEKSFQALKGEIASDKLLVHYNPQLPLILSADASPTGLGAVLSHLVDGVERPIAFASRVLSQSERNYSQIDREALSIKWSVSKFVQYLYGRHFILYTDHQPLTYIFGNKQELPVMTASRLLRYALFLQTFNFTIKYRRSGNHGNADCLSRLPNIAVKENAIHEDTLFHLERWHPSVPDETALFHLEQINILPITYDELAKETMRDPETAQMYQELRLGGPIVHKDKNWTLQGSCILLGTRVYIPTKFRKQILEELHLGHIGMVKMKSLARSHVYWPGINQDIENMVKNCTSCIEVSKNPQKVPTHYWEYPTKPWERIHIDHAGPFLGKIFFIVVDAHSKWVEVFIVPSTSSPCTVHILESLFARYGIPQTLVSDNATGFTSKDFQDFLNIYKITHKTSAPFHPASNGQAERYVATLKNALRSLNTYPGSIQQRLNTFLYSYRRAPNVTTGYSPAMLFLGREIRSRLDLLRPDPVKLISDRLHKSRTWFNDKHYEPGDIVAVRSYKSPNKKWAIGKVVAKDGILNYTIMVEGELCRRHVNQIQGLGKNAACNVPDLDHTCSSRHWTHREGSEDNLQKAPMLNNESNPGKSDEFLMPNESAEPPGNTENTTKPTTIPIPSSPTALPPSIETSENTSVRHSYSPVTNCSPVRRSTRVRRPPNRLDL